MKLQCFRFFRRLHNECMCSLDFSSSVVLNFLLYNFKVFNLWSLCVNFHPLFNIYIPFRNPSFWNLLFPNSFLLYLYNRMEGWVNKAPICKLMLHIKSMQVLKNLISIYKLGGHRLESWSGLFRIMRNDTSVPKLRVASRWPALGMPLFNGVISHNITLRKDIGCFKNEMLVGILCFIRNEALLELCVKVLQLRGENSQFQHNRPSNA